MRNPDDDFMRQLLKPVHHFDNQKIYNVEMPLFLLLNDRLLISNLIKSRNIAPDSVEPVKFTVQKSLNFYDNAILNASKTLVETLSKIF